jgi:phage terminase large subunit
MWVEKEYYWDCQKRGSRRINSEFADDIQAFLEPYSVRSIYIDPSAAAMKEEFRRRGMHVIDANNDVYSGIEKMTDEMGKGNLYVLKDCKNLIREIQSYVWDAKKSKQGDDSPLKKGDHAVDALRYAIATHKVAVYDPYAITKQQKDWMQNKYQVTRNK